MRPETCASMLKRLLAIVVVLLLSSTPGPARTRIELADQTGHTDWVSSLAFSHDGRWLASASHDGKVILWRVDSGTQFRTWYGVNGSGVAFTADGRWLLAGTDRGVQTWDVAQGTPGTLYPTPQPVHSLALSPDGTLLAAGGETWLTVWRVGDTSPRWNLRAHPNTDHFYQRPGKLSGSPTFIAVGSTGRTGYLTGVDAVAFSPDGRTLASGGWEYNVRLWDARSGTLLHTCQGHTQRITHLAFLDDARLASGTSDESIVWDVAHGAEIRYTDKAAFLSAGTTQLLASDGTGLAALSSTLQPSGHLPGQGTMMTAALSPDGRWLATATLEERLSLYRMGTQDPPRTLESAAVAVRGLSVSRDGRWLATGGEDEVHLWDLAEGVEVGHVHNRGANNSVCLHPAAPQAALMTDSGVQLWDFTHRQMRLLSTGQPAGMRPGPDSMDPHAREGDAPATFSDDGAYLASAGNVWDLRRGTRLSDISLKGRVGARSDLLIATGPEDDVTLWRLAPHPVCQMLEGPLHHNRPLMLGGRAVTGLAVSRTQPLLALAVVDGGGSPNSSPLGTLEVRDLETGAVRYARSDLPGLEIPLAFTGDGQYLLAAHDNVIDVRDPLDGHVIRHLPQGGTVSALAAIGTGDVVAASSLDGCTRLWNGASGALLATMVSIRPDAGGGWLAWSPEGFFDGSARGWQRLHFYFPGSLQLYEPEQFMREFYQPGLLADVIRSGRPVSQVLLSHGDPRGRLHIEQRDRRLPVLTIDPPAGTRHTRVSVHVQSAPAGVRDVRLFNNGTLVAAWRGPQKTGVLEATVTLVAGPNHLTAYAFNRDDVKSKDGDCVVTGPATPGRPQGWILAIGIDRYDLADATLSCAASDASALVQALRKRLPAASVHDARALGEDQPILRDGRATRRRILDALHRLAQVAQPEDTVVVACSSHGVTLQHHFCLIPSDCGTSHDQASLYRHAITDDDLAAAFAPIQAQHVVLILDACHSGGALDADDWREGPMNARGLIQLAWDKGLEVITASQSQQVALEMGRLGQGLLTYALLQGLSRGPRTAGGLLASDWLDYGKDEVPRLLQTPDRLRALSKVVVHGRGLVATSSIGRGLYVSLPGTAVQTPRVFHRREGSDWVIAR